MPAIFITMAMRRITAGTMNMVRALFITLPFALRTGRVYRPLSAKPSRTARFRRKRVRNTAVSMDMTTLRHRV